MTKNALLAAVGLSTLLFSSSASAGEITGNGKDIEIHARSECAYSGFNDQDGDVRDPGHISQSYGQNVRAGFIDPSTLDPNDEEAFFVPIPGFACNPNRGRDLHDDFGAASEDDRVPGRGNNARRR